MGSDSIPQLINELADHHGLVRQRAREGLVALGGAAVSALVEALTDPRGQVRWEAAKALAEIGDPAAAGPLVQALEDERAGVRWLAAEGLVGLGEQGLRPLLQALMARAGSPWLRQGAHFVLRNLGEHGLRAQIAPLLAALEGRQPTLEVPEASRVALAGLDSGRDAHLLNRPPAPK